MKKRKEIKINLIFLKIFSFIFLFNFLGAQAKPIFQDKEINIESSYLESKKELEDYILDTGDSLIIEFTNAPELSGTFTIDQQGEIYFKRIKQAYVRGLTVEELKILLEKKYSEFLINPDIFIRFATYKSIRVAIKGEVRNPGIVKFGAFDTANRLDFESDTKSLLDSNDDQQSQTFSTDASTINQNINSNINRINKVNFPVNDIKRSSDFVTTISNAINRVGGLSSYSDLSRIELIRDIPLGKGGGKKKAIIDFTPYLDGISSEMDIRLFDGDIIFIPRSIKRDPTILPKSILAGLTPRFINVTIAGKIESPGKITLPIEGSLSDLMNIAGPRKPLSGDIFIFRYGKDGTLVRKKVNFSANAKSGGRNNPYLNDGDIVTVRNSLFGRSAGVIREFTEPFIGVYATKELLESF